MRSDSGMPERSSRTIRWRHNKSVCACGAGHRSAHLGRLSLGLTYVATDDFPDPTIGLVWNNTDLDLNVAVSLINQFGTTRTLSSPRVTVVNNQTALLKVAENEVFFEVDVDFQAATPTSGSVTTFDSQVQTVPVGIVMAVVGIIVVVYVVRRMMRKRAEGVEAW